MARSTARRRVPAVVEPDPEHDTVDAWVTPREQDRIRELCAIAQGFGSAAIEAGRDLFRMDATPDVDDWLTVGDDDPAACIRGLANYRRLIARRAA